MQVLTYRDIPFENILNIQQECLLKVTEDKEASFLIAFEPKPTFTRGISAESRDLLWNEDQLKEKAITVLPVTRGGKWTYHGPGQIVVFPLFAMEKIGFSSRDTKGYVDLLTEAVQNFLSLHNLTTSVKETPYGVYVENKKICSFGVRMERGITTHGIALSLSSQTEPFRGINPCGQENAQLTSLWEEGIKLTWVDAASQLLESIKKSFKLT